MSKSNQQVGYVPPQALETEASLLGSMMIDHGACAKAIGILGGIDSDRSPFYKTGHQKIYDAIHVLDSQRKPVDMLSVTEQLRMNGTLEQVGGVAYVAELVAATVSPVNAEAHAKIVVDRYVAREFIRACEKAKMRTFEGGDVREHILDLEAEIGRVMMRKDDKGARHASAIFADLIAEMDSPKSDGIQGFSSGVDDFDHLSGGIRRGEQMIVAAQTSRGKTAVTVQLAREVLSKGYGVVVFMLEDSDTSYALRILSAETGIENTSLRRGLLRSANDWVKVHNVVAEHKALPLYIDDRPNQTVFSIRNELRKISAKVEIGMVIVDYIQRVHGVGETREREIASVSQGLAELWKEFRCAGVVLSQLNRTAKNAIPSLDMLRESGAIEQDARKVLLLHYPDRREGGVLPEIERCLWILAKNTIGRTGNVETDFHKPVNRFTEANGTMDSITRRRSDTMYVRDISEKSYDVDT